MERLAFLRAIARQRRAFDALAVEVRDRLIAACEAEPIRSQQSGPIRRLLILRALDRILDDYYGRYPGDESARFRQLILAHSQRVRRERFTASWLAARDILRMRAPDVLAAIRRRDQREQRP